MTPEDARTVLEEMRDGAQTAGQWVRDTDPPGLQQLRAHHVRRRDALDVALSALALVGKIAGARPGSSSYVPYEWVGWIAEASALVPQEP